MDGRKDYISRLVLLVPWKFVSIEAIKFENVGVCESSITLYCCARAICLDEHGQLYYGNKQLNDPSQSY